MCREMFFIEFSQPIRRCCGVAVADELATAGWLMMETRSKKRRIKVDGCVGEVTSTMQPTSLYGMNGICFDAQLEVEGMVRTLKASYFLPLDILSFGSKANAICVMSDENKIIRDIRPNPFRRLANRHRVN